MQALALPNPLSIDLEVAAAFERAPSNTGRDRPNVPRPPTRSHSRRVQPSQRRAPRSKKRNMKVPPEGYFRHCKKTRIRAQAKSRLMTSLLTRRLHAI